MNQEKQLICGQTLKFLTARRRWGKLSNILGTSYMVAPYSCVRCVQGWALQWSAASCGRSPEGGRGWLLAVCFIAVLLKRAIHLWRGFSKYTRRAESVAMPVLWKKYSFKKPLSLFQQRPFEPDKITYPRNWRRRSIHHLLLLLLLLISTSLIYP